MYILNEETGHKIEFLILVITWWSLCNTFVLVDI